MYAVIFTEDNDIFYLNHSCLSSMSFGSMDMAWTSDNKNHAELMCNKAEEKQGRPYREFEVIELY